VRYWWSLILNFRNCWRFWWYLRICNTKKYSICLILYSKITPCLADLNEQKENLNLNDTNMKSEETLIREFIEMKFYTKERVIEFCIEEIVERLKKDLQKNESQV